MAEPARPGESAGPLEGVRVLDFTRVLAGPYCTMMLGDYGADVIKIERPGFGDDTRGWAPPFVGGESVYFLTINRNKRSVAIDLRTSAGRELALDLARASDVVVENFRPGTMQKLGLSYEDIKPVSPGVVYCSMSGFGSRGPRQSQPGYDALVIALGGLMSITGEPDGPPVRPGVALLDVAMGIAAQGAITAALLSRERTGLGQQVDLSLLATEVGTLVNAASNYLMAGEVMDRYGSGHPSIVPYQVFEASDGFIMVGAASEGFWHRLCDVLDMPSLREDPRFITNADRVQNRDDLVAIVSVRMAERPVEEWLRRLENADVPAAPINDIAEAMSDPQVEALGLIQEVAHPVAGDVRMIGPMVEYGLTPAAIRRPPPGLGEHTDEVLVELLGMDPDQIQALRHERVVE